MTQRRRETKEAELVRVQIEMDRQQVERLDELRRRTAIRTRRELFDNALSLLERAITESEEGNRLAFLDESSNRYKVLSMPALEFSFRRKATPK